MSECVPILGRSRKTAAGGFLVVAGTGAYSARSCDPLRGPDPVRQVGRPEITTGMKIVTYNIQYGRGRDHRYDLDRIADAVSGADVIALQEVERFWSRSGGVDQPGVVARRFPGHYRAYGPGVDLHLAGAEPGDGDAGRRQFGNMLLSRTPLHTVRHHLFPKYGSLGPMSLQRSALEGVIAVRGGHVRVYSVHLTHLSAETRLPQVEALLKVHAGAVHEGPPVSGGSGLREEWTRDGMPPPVPRDAILLGDFNMEPDSEEYERIVGPMSPYGGRITNPEGFVDAWVEAGHPIDAGATAEVRGRPARLDYCFVSAGLKDRIRSARVDADAAGSDHQPVWVEIDL